MLLGYEVKFHFWIVFKTSNMSRGMPQGHKSEDMQRLSVSVGLSSYFHKSHTISQQRSLLRSVQVAQCCKSWWCESEPAWTIPGPWTVKQLNRTHSSFLFLFTSMLFLLWHAKCVLNENLMSELYTCGYSSSPEQNHSCEDTAPWASSGSNIKERFPTCSTWNSDIFICHLKAMQVSLDAPDPKTDSPEWKSYCYWWLKLKLN